MSPSCILNALRVPPDARIDKRVPKKLLLENCQPTASDRRLVQEGLEELLWVASLKPGNARLEADTMDGLAFAEIAVLHASLRPVAKAPRLAELVHRSIPYPVVLVLSIGETETVSLARKRPAQDGKRSIVTERVFLSEPIPVVAPSPSQQAFLDSLALPVLKIRTLADAYRAWIDRLTALEASEASGTFSPPASAESAAALRDAIDASQSLTRQIEDLRSLARRERQVARRVELNLEIRRLEERKTRILPGPPAKDS